MSEAMIPIPSDALYYRTMLFDLSKPVSISSEKFNEVLAHYNERERVDSRIKTMTVTIGITITVYDPPLTQDLNLALYLNPAFTFL